MSQQKLYVGNLSWGTTTDDLYTLFGEFGAVSDAFIPTDRETGRARGFAFVTLDAEPARKAIEALDGQDFQGRNIRVNEAQPQGEGRRGGGGGRGGGGYGGGGGGY